MCAHCLAHWHVEYVGAGRHSHGTPLPCFGAVHTEMSVRMLSYARTGGLKVNVVSMILVVRHLQQSRQGQSNSSRGKGTSRSDSPALRWARPSSKGGCRGGHLERCTAAAIVD